MASAGQIQDTTTTIIPAPKYKNQLQFNLKTPTKASNLVTMFKEPKPIIIEKLIPTKENIAVYDRKNYPDLVRSSSSLSSERLELAMQLAKMDVKKLKNMLADPQINMPVVVGSKDAKSEITQMGGRGEPLSDNTNQEKSSAKTGQASKKSKVREKKPNFGKVVTAAEPLTNSIEKSKLQFYNSDCDSIEDEKEERSLHAKTKEMSEIRRLQKELRKYVNRLDSVLEQKDLESRSRDPIKRKTIFEEETEQERKEHRAEEHTTRSTRVLYMLQRKVQEIQNELEEKGHNVKHTIKSQSLTRLTAAHRAAVRALQMFVNQAPLYYDLKHGLPPMYNELALLMQQLSLLSSRFQPGKDLPDFSLDMLPRTKRLIASWNQKSKKQPKVEAKKVQKKPALQKQPLREERKDRFLDEHEDWIKKKLNAIGHNLDMSNKSNEPTPERQAALLAATDAIERAKDSASFLHQDVERKRSGPKFDVPDKTGRSKAKSVLYPHRIKKFRQKRLVTDRAKRPMPSHRSAAQELGFAKQTVSSILKKQPEIIYESRKGKPRSPNSSEIPENVYITYGTPKQRDLEILKLASPKSPRHKRKPDETETSAIRSLDFDEEKPSIGSCGNIERETARQDYHGRAREAGGNHSLPRKGGEHFRQLSSGYSKVQDIVNEAERKIMTQLQPLLHKAELLSQQEKSREDEHKQSVRRKLADTAAEAAMSRGEVLAEMILDDILIETVHELGCIENEEVAEAKAVFERDQPTLENIAQRIATFEEEEESIRRRWKQLHFSEIDISGDDKRNKRNDGNVPGKERDSRSGLLAKPIIFTSSVAKQIPKISMQTTPSEGVLASTFNFHMKATLDVPSAMKASISSYREQHENFLKQTIMDEQAAFNPWEVVEGLSDEIVNELVAEVEKELDDMCNEYVERVYKDEFVKNESTHSEISVSSDRL